MFNKYTLIHEELDFDNQPTGNKFTIDFYHDDLSSVLEKVETFLKAAGFHFDGVLDIVPSESDYDDTEEEDWDWPEPPPVSAHFPFDNNMATSTLPDTITVDSKTT